MPTEPSLRPRPEYDEISATCAPVARSRNPLQPTARTRA